MGKYRAYAEYKESGVEWLGEVPSHWRLERAKFLFERKQRPVREDDGVVTAFRDGEVTLRSKRREAGFTNSLKEIGYQGVRVGDLLIHAMDGFAGAIGVSDSDGKCSPVCSVCVPDGRYGVHAQYYGRLLRHMALTGFVTALAKGIRERSTEFRFNEFKELSLALPPEEEQSQIAAFLDRETAKIDRLIAKQKALIELLKEKRQAVISHAVTKGLDPDAPMKDSGVEWLGEIPAHWEACQLGHVSKKMQTGPFGSQLHAEDYCEGGTPVINPAHMIDGIIQPEEKCTVDDSMVDKLAHHKLDAQDVVFARRGELGRCALVSSREEGWLCGTGSVKVTLDMSRYAPEFLVLFMGTTAARDALSLMSKGSTMENLNTEILGKLRVPLPRVEEQEMVVQCVSEHVEKVDDLLKYSGNVIALLQERRTALISAAVTGKIDVREEMAEVLPSVETALAVEILNRCAANCGRVKLQKLLFLSEYHGQIDTDSNYCRQAAGPLDGALLDRVEADLETFGYYKKHAHVDGSYSYLKMENSGKGSAESMIPPASTRRVVRILNALADKNTHDCEAIATVYGAWNDLLIAGKEATRTAVIDEVMNQWHQNKRQTPRSEWLRWHDWVKANMRPTGYGKPTTGRHGCQGSLLD